MELLGVTKEKVQSVKKKPFLTVNKVEAALDLLLCQQLLIHVSLFGST